MYLDTSRVRFFINKKQRFPNQYGYQNGKFYCQQTVTKQKPNIRLTYRRYQYNKRPNFGASLKGATNKKLFLTKYFIYSFHSIGVNLEVLQANLS